MTTLRRALLIDDEPLSRLELRRLLRAHPAIEVVGEVGTLSDARARLSVHDYDLVFLDIQLRGGNGFELLDSIAPTAQIVFVTAYDRFALRAFEVNALDYLLKPVGAARLAATLTRLEESRPAAGAAPALASTLPLAAEGEHALTMEDRVFVRSGASTRMLAVASICAIRSCENYTELFLSGGDVVMVLRTLKSWEQALPAQNFVRIHRQAIVNLARVKRITRRSEDEVLFELDAPVPPLAASRRQLAELRQQFSAAGLERLIP